MFTLLAPEKTGVVTRNPFADPDMWGKYDREFALGSIGTGVAAGDFDNDGRPDLLIIGKTEGCWLFRNMGNWKFQDVTEKAGLKLKRAEAGALANGLAWAKDFAGQGSAKSPTEPWRQGATFVDVDNDGWLDLYMCRFNAPNLLYINRRDGTFTEQAAARGLAITDASGMGAFCDYDRDGWLDVYVQTNMLDAVKGPNGQRGHLLRNKGGGNFVDATNAAGILGESLTHSATWWDFDHDGWPDLYVANDFAGADRLYHNQRDGTFRDVLDQVVPHSPYSSMGVDLGDVNNDGLIDLIVGDMAATTHEKDQRGMAYSRSVNRDGDEPVGIAAQYPRNALYLSTGTGRCLEAASLAGLAATDWTWAMRFEDLDNDGRLDLFVTNGMNHEYQSADLRDRVILAENPAERARLTQASPVLAEANLAFRNLGGLQFKDQSDPWGLNQVGVSFGAAFADFDGDGDLDLVYSNFEQGATVLRNDGTSGHRVTVALRGAQSNRFGVGATVRIDSAAGPQIRQLVLARGYMSNSEPLLHFGLGDDDVIKQLTVTWPSGQIQSFANLPVDRRFTITEPTGPAPAPSPTPATAGQFSEVSAGVQFAVTVREAARQEGGTNPLMPIRFCRRGPALAVGDLNGDGRDDILLGGSAAESARALRASSAMSYTTSDTILRTASSRLDNGPVLIFDATGNGTQDVLLTKAGTNQPAGSADYQPVLYLNDHGTLQPAPANALPPLPISAGAATAADFNRDGRLDVFIGGRVQPGQYPLAPRSALLLNEGGRFTDATALAPGLADVGMVTAALWSDVDVDGWPDLLVVLEWGPVKCYRNNTGRGFEDWTVKAGFAHAGSGWWTSLASADFNGDGRPDFVAGNVGLNTTYHATPEHPALLFYGRFADGGGPRLVEAYYEDGNLYPWRTRKDLGAQVPAILRKFPTNDAYARATLPEILGEGKLTAAKRFAATELRSGVFLSHADGTYQFAALPMLAQIAPLQGIATGDFDGDGCADIYAVQNSYALTVAGRADGGLSQLLRGDGRGGFGVVPPSESGLVVPGDAKALAIVDLDEDGWPDFLATRNNDTTLAFRNHGVAGRRPLRVGLRSPGGNPTGIGARIELELADGRKQTHEVTAGSGYYSQSTAACFFGYPEANPPRRLTVRWPDGTITKQELKDPSSTLFISP